MKCFYCETELHLEWPEVWCDNTGGDTCWGDDELENENALHTPEPRRVKKMAVNLEAVKYLERLQISNASYIVGRLVEGGFIEETKFSEPELFAAAAKTWVSGTGASDVYKFASGWSTSSWQHVLRESGINVSLDHNIDGLRNVFLATAILAKEAGVDL